MDKLKELLGEELYNEVMEKVGDNKIAIVSDGNWIPKAKFDDINTEKNTYKQQIDNLNGELGRLKNKVKDNDEVSETLKRLETEIENKEKEMEKLRIKNAIELEVLKTNPIDATDIIPHISTDIIKLEDNGKVIGLEEQLNRIKQEKPYLFKDNQPTGTGGSKGAGPKDEKEPLDKSIGKKLAERKKQQVETEQDAQSLYFKTE